MNNRRLLIAAVSFCTSSGKRQLKTAQVDTKLCQLQHVVLPGTLEHRNIPEHPGAPKKPGTPPKTRNTPQKTRNTPQNIKKSAKPKKVNK